MSGNKVTYQTNFTGIKYNNNLLAVDANSFSNSNNVYLNKYNALISRPPIAPYSYPWQVYGADPVPIYLKLVATYDLSTGGTIYVIYNEDSELYMLRYKTAAGAYSTIITSVTIQSFSDFKLVRYKQYYILFTVDGTRVLDINTDTWSALSTKVDVPITSIQTGNEQLTLDGNQLTAGYKKQFIVKPDSDDTIYALPTGQAAVSFPAQTDVTYNLVSANEYTRDRLLRKLNIPKTTETGLISMVGEKIAVAYQDRLVLSLDSGDTFETIIYPTVASSNYKNTASLSDDGQCFFYVHSDGVYRYMLGTREWLLIEVSLDMGFVLDPVYTTKTVEKPVTGVLITSDMIGANYGHFINAEKFAFVLAYYTSVSGSYKWISVVYTKGLNMSNLYHHTYADVPNYILKDGSDLLNSYAYTSTGAPIQVIGTSLTDIGWTLYPYINKRLLRIVDNNTVVFYNKIASNVANVLVVKAAMTHLYLAGDYSAKYRLNYIDAKTGTISVGSSFLINELEVVTDKSVKILVKTAANASWYTQLFVFSQVEINWSTTNPTYVTTFTITTDSIDGMSGFTTALVLNKLTEDKYISTSSLRIVENDSVTTSYALSFTIVPQNFIKSGTTYIVGGTSGWYTNLPIQTTLIYTYLSNTEFTQVPTAVFDDQNLWLAMDKTLWIGNLVDDKLSVPPINNNVFSKTITAISPISATSKAIFFEDSITLCEQLSMSDGSIVWQYYPLKFSVGVRQGDTVVITNDGKFTIFPTKYGLAALTYQLDIAATEQAITYLTDDIKTMWSSFYNASNAIKIIHHNTQLILSNGTNQVLIYDLRTSGWYPLTFPVNVKVAEIHTNATNYEILELIPADTGITNMTAVYSISKENDELYTYISPYRDTVLTGSLTITWHLTSQILLLDAPNHYKNISQLIIDQMDSNELKQSAYLTTQLFRQTGNVIKPSVELIYNIDTFAKITKKVNWWKVLGLKWQLNNDATSSYPTQLRLYNMSIKYDISYEVK